MAPTRNTALIVIRLIVWVFMIGAAAISTRHIVQTAGMLGLGWERFTVPAFVDGIAIVGKTSMLPRFSPAFRRSGFRLLMFGGTLSLAANVAAGANWGQRSFGVLVVAGFMILESHATKADRKTAEAPAPKRAGKTCKPGCTCRRHSPAAKLTPQQKAAITKKTRKAEKELAAMVGGYTPADAPVSPAV